jgi:hypothetical protein
MSTAGGRIVCKQCQAKSKRSQLQCKAPALKGKNVCRAHGGLSTGPKTEQGRQRCAEAKTVHGDETRAKRAERSRKSAELHRLVDLGNAIGLFNGRAALRGRRPKEGSLEAKLVVIRSQASLESEAPFDSSSLTRWCKRIADEGIETLLMISIRNSENYRSIFAYLLFK